MSEDRAERLRATVGNFCQAFLAGSAPTELLDKYFTSSPQIIEHGPLWAKTPLPFLGTTFSGRRTETNSDTTCDDYYDVLASTLSFHPGQNTVPSKEEFLVSIHQNVSKGKWEVGAVTVKLHAKFTIVKTSKSWEQDFVYVLTDCGDDAKIEQLELWADPLSAWMAVGD